jgi:uncharacterized protein
MKGSADRDLKSLIERLHRVLDRVEPLLPERRETDFDALAYRWRPPGWLQPIRQPHLMAPEDLLGVDAQKQALLANTEQFVRGLPANNALLWGSRGTGKSSLIKTVLTAFHDRGLRLIEVDKHDLAGLPEIVERIEGRPERYLIFCDDLSFEADDPSYKTLKAILDGSLTTPPDNLLIYATSNRRHLLPEFQSENQAARIVDGELHHGEAVEEKISLSERFGIWLSFYPFTQEQYLEIVQHWLHRLGTRADDAEQLRLAALRFARARGSRSGRVAWQFARDLAGRQGLLHSKG